MKSKKLVILSLLMGLNYSGNAQEFAVDKGANFISGIANFTSSGGDLFEFQGDRLITIGLTPSMNHFVVDNFYVGLGLEVAHQSQGVFTNNAIGFGPQIGVALGDSSSTTFPIFEFGAKYTATNFKVGSDESKASGSDVFFGLGVILPVRTHLGLTAQGTYHILSLKPKGSGSIGSTSGNIFSFGIGITGLLF